MLEVCCTALALPGKLNAVIGVIEQVPLPVTNVSLVLTLSVVLLIILSI